MLYLVGFIQGKEMGWPLKIYWKMRFSIWQYIFQDILLLLIWNLVPFLFIVYPVLLYVSFLHTCKADHVLYSRLFSYFWSLLYGCRRPIRLKVVVIINFKLFTDSRAALPCFTDSSELVNPNCNHLFSKWVSFPFSRNLGFHFG